MNLLANSLAVLLMTVAPLIRPCNCGEFTLFCQCGAEAGAAANADDMPAEPQCPK